MEKSLVLTVENFKGELYNLVNGSNISPYFLEPIFKDIYIEIRDAAQEQIKAEQEAAQQQMAQKESVSNDAPLTADAEELKGDLGVEMPFMNNMPIAPETEDTDTKSEN